MSGQTTPTKATTITAHIFSSWAVNGCIYSESSLRSRFRTINLQVVFNKILRKIWNLPFNYHTNIVHCVSRIVSIKNLIVKHFILLYQRALSCSSLVRNVFSFSSSLLYTFVGYNLNCATSHVTEYSETDIYIADCIRLVGLNFGNVSVFEDYISIISTV